MAESESIGIGEGYASAFASVFSCIGAGDFGPALSLDFSVGGGGGGAPMPADP